MKFPCACGCVIHDTSDNLSYKCVALEGVNDEDRTRCVVCK